MPDTKIIHNVSADSATSPQDIQSLLVSQLYSPVRWVETCNFISTLDLPIIECGPGKVLSGLFKANKLDNYYSTSENFGLTKTQFKNTVKECNFYDL